MSQESVEVVRDAFDTFNAFIRGERSEKALAALADPEFEYDWPAERKLPEAGHLRGAPEVFAFIERLQNAWVDFAWEPIDFRAAPGNRVLTTVCRSGQDRESGLRAEAQLFQVFTIKEGRVRKVEFFRHRDEALKAAGLRE
jgi:ketosteroid isomerase-like protein